MMHLLNLEIEHLDRRIEDQYVELAIFCVLAARSSVLVRFMTTLSALASLAAFKVL